MVKYCLLLCLFGSQVKHHNILKYNIVLYLIKVFYYISFFAYFMFKNVFDRVII
jgi:hypothetical protein